MCVKTKLFSVHNSQQTWFLSIALFTPLLRVHLKVSGLLPLCQHLHLFFTFIPAWLWLLLSPFNLIFITIIIIATTTSPPFVHHLSWELLVTASVPIMSLSLSPCSIHLACKSSGFIYRFLYCFSCARLPTPDSQLPTSSTNAHAVLASFVLSDPTCLYIFPPAWY